MRTFLAALVAVIGAGCTTCSDDDAVPNSLCVSAQSTLVASTFTGGASVELVLQSTVCTTALVQMNPVITPLPAECDVSALPAGAYAVTGTSLVFTIPLTADAGVPPCTGAF